MKTSIHPALASIGSTAGHHSVYEPSDDSFLLADAVAEYLVTSPLHPKLCVEIGCGSGYVICSVAQILANIGGASHCIAVDINPHATHCTRETLENHEVQNVDLVTCNLLDPLLDHLRGLVDLLVFNPPYVPTPEEEVERVGIAQAWAGGNKGRSVTDKILPHIPRLLSKQGSCFIVAVAENNPKEIIQQMEAVNLKGSIVASRQADEENLCIIKLNMM